MQNLACKIGLKKTGVGGKFLSEYYKGINQNHKWQCGKCGRIWDTSPNSVLYQESWCKRCSGRETWSYEQMVDLARKRGKEKTGIAGKFLISREEYEKQSYPDRSKYQWECGKCGYIWKATANNIKRRSWCRICQYTLLSRMFKKPYQEILKLANKVGIIKTGYAGTFLASEEEYNKVKTPSHHKFKWKCGNCKDIFEMDISHVRRPQWCPSCTEGESEQICRGFFERIFKGKFPKLRSERLVNSFSGG
jgi:rubrerythrin